MQKLRSRQSGISLLEVLLALAIAALLLILGLRFYQTLNRDKDFDVVGYNVDTLFNAMGNYYRAQCYGTTNPTKSLYNPDKSSNNAVDYGALNPNSDNFANPLILDVNNDLQTPGYLSRPLSFSYMVDNDKKMPYEIQFIESTQKRTMLTCSDYKSNGECDNEEDTNVATIVIWTAQVAVKLSQKIAANPQLAKSYAYILNAKCLATAAEIEAGTACETSGIGTGDYVVWQRLPTATPTKGGLTVFTLGNAIVSEFTQMYTTYPDLYLKSLPKSNNGELPDGSQQYIYCGS